MKKNGLMLGLFSVASYSLNTPLSRAIMLEGMSPISLLLLRFALAGIVFSVIMRFSGFAKAKEGQLKMSWGGFSLALFGGIMNGASAVSYYYGVLQLDASMAAMIGAAVYSVTALVIGSFVNNGLTPHTLLRLGLGLLGLYFLIGPSGGDISMLGAGLVAFASFIYGAYLVFIQKYLGDYNISAISEISIWGVVMTILSFWVLFDGGAIQVSSTAGWITIVIQAIIVSILGRFAMLIAIKQMGSSEYALLSPMETLLAVLWSILFLSETLSQGQIIGATLVLSGLLISGDWFSTRFNQLFSGRRRTLRRVSVA
ncbi:MAG: drug/metabolite transporter (DMT)-like permease [Cellvibrionaceae bacterium]|jgi:drug/metabolite transporter (DMT)-like permease